MERIVAIAGKPGLYRLVSQGKNMLIVENIATGKRTPTYASDKVVSLADIAIYTTGDDEPLYNIYASLVEKTGGKPIDLSEYNTPDKLRALLAEVLPSVDNERVHNSDVKKLFAWYNTMVANGVTDFKDEDIAEDQSADAADPEAANASDVADNGLNE